VGKGNIGGANGRIRTDDLLITNELLYQLSYIGCMAAYDGDFDSAWQAETLDEKMLANNSIRWQFMRTFKASVAQLVEHHLAKVNVEGSNPFARSIFL